MILAKLPIRLEKGLFIRRYELSAWASKRNAKINKKRIKKGAIKKEENVAAPQAYRAGNP